MRFRKSRRTARRYRPVTLRSKLRKERRRKVGKIALFGIIAVAVGYGALTAWRVADRFLFKSDNFDIRAIEVLGGENVTQSEILALLPFRKGDNILRIRAGDAEKNIRQCKPELKSISISRSWKKVVVELKERVPVACVAVSGEKFGVDSENMVFPLRGKLVHEPLPEILNQDADSRKSVLEFIKQFKPAAKELYQQVSSFSVESVNDIVFEFKGGTRVLWGLPEKEKLSLKLKRLNQVMEDTKSRFTDIEYISLCYFDNGRILVKPRGNHAAAVTDDKNL